MKQLKVTITSYYEMPDDSEVLPLQEDLGVPEVRVNDSIYIPETTWLVKATDGSARYTDINDIEEAIDMCFCADIVEVSEISEVEFTKVVND